MTEKLDRDYWERHWREATGSDLENTPNPYLAIGTSELTPGTALDAGCGIGAEARWLAAHGWRVTAVDISAEALAIARRDADPVLSGSVDWVEADLTTWDPGRRFDLVTTHYAHPETSQLDFYERISGWVAPGGTLLIVGHLHTGDSQEHEDDPPVETTVTVAEVIARLDETQWQVLTAEQHEREAGGHGGHPTQMHDVVVRATRRR